MILKCKSKSTGEPVDIDTRKIISIETTEDAMYGVDKDGRRTVCRDCYTTVICTDGSVCVRESVEAILGQAFSLGFRKDLEEEDPEESHGDVPLGWLELQDTSGHQVYVRIQSIIYAEQGAEHTHVQLSDGSCIYAKTSAADIMDVLRIAQKYRGR